MSMTWQETAYHELLNLQVNKVKRGYETTGEHSIKVYPNLTKGALVPATCGCGS